MPIGDCLQFGWEAFKRHTAALVFSTFVLCAANLLVNAVSGFVLRRFAFVGGMVVTGLFWGGMAACARKAAHDQEPTLSDAFQVLTIRPGDYLLVGLAIDIGVLACGVGAVVTAFLFLFAPLCVVEGADWKQALARSKDIVLANVGESIVFYLVLIVVNIAGFMALGIGLLVTLPVTTLAIVRAYELASTPDQLPPSGSTPASAA